MLAFLFNWRSKSFLRSSSGPSYPYPRTHTTLMVVPSSRPIGPEEATSVKKQSSRRRPPLNRSIPPIPESKSNESIMSQASRRSTDKGDDSQPSDCVVIENRTVVQQLHRNQKNNTGFHSKKFAVAGFIKRDSSANRADVLFERLLDAALSFINPSSLDDKETFRAEEQSQVQPIVGNTSKSFGDGREECEEQILKANKNGTTRTGRLDEGKPELFRPKTSVPKRIDQNANRVIKSSSMDVASTSQDTSAASTSKHMVVIPQNPTRLEDFSEEASLAEQVLQKENEDPEQRDEPTPHTFAGDHLLAAEPLQAVSMTLNADVLVVTKEVDSDSALPHRTETRRVIEVEEKTLERPERVVICQTQQTTQIVSNNDFINNSSASVPEPAESEHAEEEAHKNSVGEEPEEASPDSTGLRSPQLQRKHHTFILGEKIPDTSSELIATAQEIHTEEKEASGREHVEEPSCPSRYIMTVKTPEAMRKHLAFFVSEGEPKDTAVASSPKKKKKKIIKQRSMPESSRPGVSPERYVLKVKTPEALRRHHTFTITERARSPDVPYIEEGEITEPIATVGPTAEKLKRVRSESAKRDEKEKNKLERLTMAVKTPFTMRKFKTFMVEDKPKAEDIPTSRSVEALTHAKVSFSQNVEEDEEGRHAGSAVRALATPHTKRKQIEREHEEAKEESEPLDDHNEKFILTTSTPLAMRKFQTFMIEDKKPTEQPVKSHTVGNFDAIANLEREAEISEEAPLKTSDMYVLTTMTPLPQRKERASESHLERIAREKSRSTSRSPEKVGLFIMGSRSSRSYYQMPEKEAVAEKEAESVKCAVVQPQRAVLGLESPRKERSQSDNAEPIERKASCSSGEMTSPEEEIPMDTHLTPTEEVREDALIIRPIRRPPEVTSPIAEEPEVSASFDLHQPQRSASMKVNEVPGYHEVEARPPVFRPPSPPKEMYKPITSSRSTSPLRRKESSEKSDVTASPADGKVRARLTVRSKSEDRKEKKAEEKEKERLKKGKREERERDKERLPKSPKMPITASILRSLRSAGKMLAPSFFRKGESKIPKSSKTTTSPPIVTVTKPRMSLPFRNGRRAPLAEFESLVVEDSPAVENHPLTFEKWNNSPRGKRRHSAHVNGFSEPIVEESDGNGNVSAPVASRVECVMSPALPRHEPDRGLIDDEILDQPMLVGDTFSHSESIDCLSAVRRMEFEAEKATLISIDRSLIEDIDTMPRRTYDNGNAQSTATRAAAVFTAPPSTYRKALEDGLNEVEDIRSQLEKLQYLVSQEMRTPAVDETREALLRENEALRRELLEKDELISSLRQQIAAQHQ
ncbi:hypothetical protein Aduo_012227 [Ancylostoma duodenale]